MGNMQKVTILFSLFVFVLPVPLPGASRYTARLDDPEAVYLTKDRFAVQGDGVADDSAGIQSAIDAVETTHGEGILFVPEGKYRITRTIYVWPGVRIIGYGGNRPVFVLADNTPGYQRDLGYMFFFAGGRPGSIHERWHGQRTPRPPTEGTVPPNSTVPDASPGTFYSAMSNVDFSIGEGNSAAVAIRFHAAQHCFLAHIDFHTGSGLAALKDIGNEAEDLHFYGGDYGIVTEKPSPGWQFTLLDSVFEGQRIAAIQEHEAGLTLVHDLFQDVPAAVSIDPTFGDELWIENSRMENISGPAVTISNQNNPKTQINLVNIACHNVKTFALLRESGRGYEGPGDDYEVQSFSHGLMIPTPGMTGKIETEFHAQQVKRLPPFGRDVIAGLPPDGSWVNLHTLGARGDGVTDDTKAIQQAIATHRFLYVPEGRYVVTDTLQLRPDTVLVGLHPSMTQFDLPDGTAGFQGPGEPRPLLEAPKGGHDIVEGIGLSTEGINDRAVGAMWMAGADSLMDDVRFLGGHGTNAADGSRINPYNNTHTADPDIRRRWNAQYPSLWVTDGGGGTFADIWTPDTFAQAGLYVSDTTTPGNVYELSSEHHVENEVKLDRVENWNLVALQTEEERGESAFALPLAISRSKNITVANYHGYRVVSSYEPRPDAVEVSESNDIRFRNAHVDSDSKAAFDNSVADITQHTASRAHEFARMDVPGEPQSAAQPGLPTTLKPSAAVRQLATGFFNISGAAVNASGELYFVDAHWHRIYRWNAENREAVIVRDNPLDPVNLGFDNQGNVLVVSYAGEGVVYSFRPDQPESQITLLKAKPAQARIGMTPLLPADVWGHGSLGSPREWQYVSPDGTTFIPAGDDFVKGQLYYGTNMADVLRAFSLARAVPGKPFYISDEEAEKTYKGTVTNTGSVKDLQLFADEGGESVVQDRDGNVYLAAGQILVYSPGGKLIGQIDVPERPIDLLFGGPDRRTLFILTHHSLYAAQVKVPGLQEYTKTDRRKETGDR